MPQSSRRKSDLLRTTLPTLLVFLAVAGTVAQAADKHTARNQDLVYVGTYTGHGSEGIYAFRFDAAIGELTPLGLAAQSDNPAFLAIDPSHKFLYAANETDHFKDQPTGAVSAFSIDQATAKLSLLNQVSAQDAGPAFVGLDRTGKDVLVTNYANGSVAVFPLLASGQLGDASDFVKHQGSSVNPERQQGPHAHSFVMSPDDRFALVADLGLDEVIIYPFDADKGKLGPPHVVKVHPGSGPRHLIFSADGRFVFLLNEIASTVTVFAYQDADGTLRELQTISTLPPGFPGTNTAAEIQVLPSGKFLYASNRGEDSIAIFAVDRAKGTLTPAGRVSTEGKTPRNFAIDPSGAWLLAGNQNSNNIVSFSISPKTGGLTPNGQISQVGSPACIQFMPLP